LDASLQMLCRDEEALQKHLLKQLTHHKPRSFFYKEPKAAQPAAVLIPLFFKDGKAHILFTKRSEDLEQHKGQISFPGGRMDPDDAGLKAAALRETHEEVGIKHNDVNILGQTDTFLTNSDYLVTPFVGMVPHPYNYQVNPAEIDRLIEAPLEHFLSDAYFHIEEREHKGYRWHIHFYTYRDDLIWGVTGFLLSNFLSIAFGLKRSTQP